MNKPDLQARVNRGATWLDKHIPDWYTFVSLRRFDITHECRCVLGQVFKPTQSSPSSRLISLAKSLRKRFRGYETWGDGYTDAKEIISNQWATACGFDMGEEASFTEDGWAELQRLWKIEITARKQSAVSG